MQNEQKTTKVKMTKTIETLENLFVYFTQLIFDSRRWEKRFFCKLKVDFFIGLVHTHIYIYISTRSDYSEPFYSILTYCNRGSTHQTIMGSQERCTTSRIILLLILMFEGFQITKVNTKAIKCSHLQRVYQCTIKFDF